MVVSWNVQDHLARCLEALPEACKGLNWECVVVDNDSSDDSVEVVQKLSEADERFDVIVNKENFGFARACNQGAVQHKARYVLLLNPDTECTPGSLYEMVRKADALPEVGVMGPKITYPDGRYQESVRRFPRITDQLMISLKLHLLWPDAAPLKRYFHHDLRQDESQEVDQVMGSCFLVRAACWDRLHGLDPRYFIWFEEVDFCRQAKERDWRIRYEPSVSIVHHGGQAFSKVFALRRQRVFNRSLLAYMHKWYGFSAWLLFVLLQPISLSLALAAGLWLKLRKDSGVLSSYNKKHVQRPTVQKVAVISKTLRKQIAWWSIGIVTLEIVSLAVNGQDAVNTALTILAALVMLYAAYKRPAAAISAVAVELLIGGFGYLLRADVTGFGLGISLRMGLMAGFMCGWGINAIKNRVWRYWEVKELILRSAWVFMAVMVLAGLARGLMLKQPHVFADANGWLFLLYFIPVLDIANRFGQELKRVARAALAAGIIWLPIKMLLTFYVFTHFPDIVPVWYSWIRDTRVGEITPAGGQLVRIFFQSGIYAIPASVLIFAWLLDRDSDTGKNESENKPKVRLGAVTAVLALSMSGIIISLSRSFWLGLAAGSVAMVGLGIWSFRRLNWRPWLHYSLGLLLAFVVLGVVLRFPLPTPRGGDFGQLFKERGNLTDAAASSRWNLLPAMWQKILQDPVIGHGFGSTVTYESRDPRVLAISPDGKYTTYAFEWGWLALWIKFGAFGIPIMLWFIISAAWRLWRSPYSWWIRAGGVASTCALAVVHIFTPFLDHPLGFSWILGVEGLLALASPHPLFAIKVPEKVNGETDIG